MAGRRVWWITGGVVAVVAAGAIGGPLVYAALEEDAAPAATVRAQPSDAVLVAETDGTWQVAAGSSARYRVDEVLNGAKVGRSDAAILTAANITDELFKAQAAAEHEHVPGDPHACRCRSDPVLAGHAGKHLFPDDRFAPCVAGNGIAAAILLFSDNGQ